MEGVYEIQAWQFR